MNQPRVELVDADKLRRALRRAYPDEAVTERGYARAVDISPAHWNRTMSGEVGINGRFIAAVLLALPGSKFERWFRAVPEEGALSSAS